MDDFAVWLQEQRTCPNFQRFMGNIIEKRDYKLKSSLAQGDTNFSKGEYRSLDWVVNLPEELFEQLTATDTSEPLA